LAELAVDFLMDVTLFAVMNHVITGRNDQNDFAYGFGRVMFPFFTGVLLCRFRSPQRMAARASLGLMSGRAAILLVPVTPQVLLAACPTFLCRFRRSLRWARRLSRAEAGWQALAGWQAFIRNDHCRISPGCPHACILTIVHRHVVRSRSMGTDNRW
jgi:hypothetical protein